MVGEAGMKDFLSRNAKAHSKLCGGDDGAATPTNKTLHNSNAGKLTTAKGNKIKGANSTATTAAVYVTVRS